MLVSEVSKRASPFSLAAVDLLQRVGQPLWKIASGEVSNAPLLDRVLDTGSPVVISTGMSPLAARRAIELADLEGLSGRGTERLIRVARTIADLANASAVLGEHLEEAARFRSPLSMLAAREAS